MSALGLKPRDRERFLVTTLLPMGKASEKSETLENLRRNRTVLWETGSPLALGQPFRWALERTEKGIRVRKLGVTPDQVIENAFEEFSIPDVSTKLLPLFSEENGESTHPVLWLRINPVMGMPTHPVTPNGTPSVIPVSEMLGSRRESKIFLAPFPILLILFGYFLFTAHPSNPGADEVLPAQFAKLLLSPALKQKVIDQSKLAQKAPKPSVVQVLKNEAVKKSVDQLFKASSLSGFKAADMLKGLDSASHGAKSRAFESKSESGFRPLNTGPLSIPSANVTLLGVGKGASTAERSYASDVAAKVDGQGAGQVDLGAKEMNVEEGLTKEEVGRAIRDHLGEIRYCYMSALARNPGVEGKLGVDFVIGASGGVKSAKVTEPTSDEALNQCIVSRLQKWSFPKPHGGIDVGVSFPFIFKLLGT